MDKCIFVDHIRLGDHHILMKVVSNEIKSTHLCEFVCVGGCILPYTPIMLKLI